MAAITKKVEYRYGKISRLKKFVSTKATYKI